MKEEPMATYVTLINWTDQGVRNVKDSIKRADAFAQMVEGMGGKVKDIYWTIGPYDIVALIEAPDDESATVAALKVAALGNVRTTTLRAFNSSEFSAIIDRTG
jgi:uncharacterized protein with GYD domain